MSETPSPVARFPELSEQLRLAQHMDLVGRLASAAVHDFNNLLSVILGYSELAQATLAPTDELWAFAEEVHHAAQQGTALARQLLALSFHQAGPPMPVNLNAILARMERMLHRLLGPQIDLFVIPDPALAAVRIDPDRLEQVILNLCLNAREAMPEGGKLRLITTNVEAGTLTVTHPHVPPGAYVTLVVRDTGHGMDSATKARLFEPFFTTKDPARHAGLGLASVHAVVTESGGHVSVDSDPEHGAAFTIFLPRVNEPVAPPPSDPPAPPSLSAEGSETILLLEPDDALRIVIRRMLEKKGYRVLEARHSEEARLFCMVYHPPIHLLVTELLLPHQTGTELAESLGNIRSEVRPLFLATAAPSCPTNLPREAQLLLKPFGVDELARKVRQVLKGG